MEKVNAFLKRKNIVFSAKRYGIDALGAMAQGLFCSLLIGTILNTLGTQFHIGFLTAQIGEKVPYTIGGLTSFMSGPAMAIAIGYALQAPPLVLFSLAAVGYACNLLGGAGGPLAVLFVAIIAAECGKAVSKETKIDILVTPIVTTLIGVGTAYVIAPPIGTAASAFGMVIMKATELQPFLMGILVSVLVGVALTLPISSAAICSVLGLTGLAGGAAVAGCCAQMVGFAVMSFRENGWGGLVSQGLGTSMLQMPNIVKNPFVFRFSQLHGHLPRPQSAGPPQDRQKLAPVKALRQPCLHLRRQQEPGQGQRFVIQRQKAAALRFRRVKGHVDRRRLPLRLRVQHDGHAVFPPQTAAQLLPAEGDLQYEIPVTQSQLRHRPHHLAGEGVRRDQHPRPGGVFPPEPQQLSAPVRGDGPPERQSLYRAQPLRQSLR